jgi:hypothetical protein
MTTKQQYNYKYLQEFCTNNEITLSRDYSDDKITRETMIVGNCKTKSCDQQFCKKFKPLTVSGGFCKGCTELNRQHKASEITKKYTLKLLFELCKKDGIILLEDYDEAALNAHTFIKGVCSNLNCEKTFNKKILQLFKTNSFCKECSIINGRTKMKNTMISKYGVEHPSQSNELQTKMKDTLQTKYGVNNVSQINNVKIKKIKTSLQNWGVEHPTQNADIQNKIKQTCLNTYGVEHPLQNADIQNKITQTCLNTYGVEHPLQNNDVYNKVTQTCLLKYGVKYVQQNKDIYNKSISTCLEKYGYSKYSQTDECKLKCIQTSLHNWGTDYPMQNTDIAVKSLKNSYNSKEYVFPSGKTIHVQGYEDIMLDELLQKENILEEDIITSRSEVPTIWYLDANNKKRRYYVDVFIPSQNRMIECKSTWTLQKGIEKDNVYLKQQACKDAGYSCEIWVYNDKKEKVNCIL